jgi:hypothetical protein
VAVLFAARRGNWLLGLKSDGASSSELAMVWIEIGLAVAIAWWAWRHEQVAGRRTTSTGR